MWHWRGQEGGVENLEKEAKGACFRRKLELQDAWHDECCVVAFVRVVLAAKEQKKVR